MFTTASPGPGSGTTMASTVPGSPLARATTPWPWCGMWPLREGLGQHLAGEGDVVGATSERPVEDQLVGAGVDQRAQLPPHGGGVAEGGGPPAPLLTHG